MQRGEIELVAITSLIFAVISVIFFYFFIFSPFIDGPMRAMEADEYCVQTFSVSGFGENLLGLEFSRLYYADFLELYVVPGGSLWDKVRPSRINLYAINRHFNWVPIGHIENIKEEDIGIEIPCMGSRTALFGDQDKCNPYQGEIYGIVAEVEGVACLIGLNCGVDLIKVTVYYKCNYEATVMEGRVEDPVCGSVGWSDRYPLTCISGTYDLENQSCSIEGGEYFVRSTELIQQMNFPGTPLVRVGARSGCKGVQTGCNVRVFFGKPNDLDGCDSSGISWNLVHTFNNLDYNFIYSLPITLPEHININQSSAYYRRWCMKTEINNCYVNSIDVQRYTR